MNQFYKYRFKQGHSLMFTMTKTLRPKPPGNSLLDKSPFVFLARWEKNPYLKYNGLQNQLLKVENMIH